MIIVSEIRACLNGLVGFRQTGDYDYPLIESDLLVSDSGNYFNSHPLINTPNLHAIAPNWDDWTFPSYDVARTYAKGDTANEGGIRYVSAVDNNIGNPVTDANFWQPFPGGAGEGQSILFSKWLREIVEEGQSELINKILTLKKLNKNVKSPLNDIDLFRGAGRLTDLIINQGDFVGFEIRFNNWKGLKLSFTRIGTQFNANIDPLTVYVFHSSSETAIATASISYNSAINFQWTSSDIQVKYDSGQYETGGIFYIGYFQDDLGSVQAINKSIDFNKQLCYTCNADNRFTNEYRRQYSRFITVNPIRVPSGDLNGTDYWLDPSKVNYLSNRNWGLNLTLKVDCDMSDQICRQQQPIAEPLQKFVQMKLLRQMVNSTRKNGIQQIDKERAAFELDANENPMGLAGQLKDSLKALEFDLSDMNSACLPDSTRGIKIR